MLSFFVGLTADEELCAAGVIDGYRRAAGISVPAPDVAMLKSKQAKYLSLRGKEALHNKLDFVRDDESAL